MALRDEIRAWVLIQGKSQRAAARHIGLSRNTVAKLLAEEPAATTRRYQRQVRKTPVSDAALSQIDGWLQENERLRRWAPKQCWKAHRMWVELGKLGMVLAARKRRRKTMSSTDESRTTKLTTFAEQAAVILRQDERVRILWLTGSLAKGTADAQSDVDLRVAVRAADFATIDQWWQDLLSQMAPLVWKYRWPGPPDEAVLGAITADYLRFDVVIQSLRDTRPRTLEAARLIFDKDGEAEHFLLTIPSAHDPYAHLSVLVEDYIRLLGMLPIVVGRNDVPIGMEGQLALHSMLISLLLLENGIDRMTTGKRHVAAFLNEEQRAILAQVPSLAPTMDSLIQGRVAYGRLGLPRARRLMQAHGQVYPEAFEAATKRHLWETLGLRL